LEEATENFHVDLAGHYNYDEEIQTAVNWFKNDLPIESGGYLRAGQYRLPDGRTMLVISDVQLGLLAD